MFKLVLNVMSNIGLVLTMLLLLLKHWTKTTTTTNAGWNVIDPCLHICFAIAIKDDLSENELCQNHREETAFWTQWDSQKRFFLFLLRFLFISFLLPYLLSTSFYHPFAVTTNSLTIYTHLKKTKQKRKRKDKNVDVIHLSTLNVDEMKDKTSLRRVVIVVSIWLPIHFHKFIYYLSAIV